MKYRVVDIRRKHQCYYIVERKRFLFWFSKKTQFVTGQWTTKYSTEIDALQAAFEWQKRDRYIAENKKTRTVIHVFDDAAPDFRIAEII